MILIILFFIFVATIIIYRDDEKLLYKIFFIMFTYTIFVLFFRFTKGLGDELERDQIEKLEQEKQRNREISERDYEQYVQDQVSQIIWKVPQ